MTEVSVAWEAKCLVGEGPTWFADEGILRFVDIRGQRILSYRPDTGEKKVFEVDANPAFIVPDASGGAIVGSLRNLYRFIDGELSQLVEIPEDPGNRANDATVDAMGRLWFGTMDPDHKENAGSIWRYDGAQLERMGPRAAIPNGPTISPDGRWLYHVDTLKRQIWRFPLEDLPVLEGGALIAEIAEGEGMPDGIVFDSEGCFWIGLWDGWGVRRYTAEGELLAHVDMPCANVTKLAFGGKDMDTAFVTTASVRLTEEQLKQQPLAGSLFTFSPGVKGLAANKARI